MRKATIIRYVPPKSNLWEHRMGNKSPAAFREGVAAFLQQAAFSHRVTECYATASTIVGDEAGSAFIRTFADENELPGGFQQETGLTYLSEETFERCLTWLISHQDLLPLKASRTPWFHVSLTRTHEIEAWREGTVSETTEPVGLLDEGFGGLQYLGTRFAFASVAEYQRVKTIAQATLGIRMNDQNVRPRGALSG